MKKYLLIFLLLFTSSTCHCKSVQNFSQNLSMGSNSLYQGITNAGKSIGNMIAGIKDIFDDTDRRLSDQADNQKFQELMQNYQNVQNKYKIIYDYVHRELSNIISVQKDANLNRILNNGIQTDDEENYILDKFQLVLSNILKLFSIWQSITQLSTPEQVSQFLGAHTSFYEGVGNQYVGNKQQNYTSNNSYRNNYQSMSNNRQNFNGNRSVNNANHYTVNNSQYNNNQNLQNYTTQNLSKYIMKKLF